MSAWRRFYAFDLESAFVTVDHLGYAGLGLKL